MSDEAVRKQAEGILAEISERGDWTTFHINVGRQYPLRLETKLDALIQAGRAAKGQTALWTFTESQGGENPNKPGSHYINRRLEKVEIGGTPDPALASASAAASPGAGGGGIGGGKTDAERISIERQSLVKAAIVVFPMVKIESEDDWFGLLDRLDDWMGRDRATGNPAPAAQPAAAAAAEPPPEDDIPF